MGVDRLAKSASWLFELGMVGRKLQVLLQDLVSGKHL